MRAWGVAVVLIAGAMAARAQAQTPDALTPLFTCQSWLASPASKHDGETWIYGFWDGMIQGLGGGTGALARLPNLDLMMDDVVTNCQNKPASTLAEAASLTLEKGRQGMFSERPPGK